MKIVSVVGARPQLVKLAPIAAALDRAGHRHVIVHTGQHYDAELSDVFFAGLSIPDPDVQLEVGSASHGAQTAAMLERLEPVLEKQQPDWVLVYGDTNSTLAGALTAVKLHLPVAHLEAGLRSFNRRMPEEHNRVLADHAADLCLAPTTAAMDQLAAEGLAGRSALVGDVMADVCLRVRDAVLSGAASDSPPKFGVSHSHAESESSPVPIGSSDGVSAGEPYLLATLHRPGNTDDPAMLAGLLGALAGLPLPVLLPAHPRLVARAGRHGIALERGSIRLRRPLPYAELVAAVLGATGVVTDSGGLQKEAYLLGRPCTTLRAETEWTETLVGGWNVLVARPQDCDPAAWARVATRPAPRADRGTPYGDGHAAERVVETLAEMLQQ
jgi:UDP-N-acetylglucosamine 2-epimerase (non-hydrolysing)